MSVPSTTEEDAISASLLECDCEVRVPSELKQLNKEFHELTSLFNDFQHLVQSAQPKLDTCEKNVLAATAVTKDGAGSLVMVQNETNRYRLWSITIGAGMIAAGTWCAKGAVFSTVWGSTLGTGVLLGTAWFTLQSLHSLHAREAC